MVEASTSVIKACSTIQVSRAFGIGFHVFSIGERMTLRIGRSGARTTLYHARSGKVPA
jgi:hypothetical protein